MSLNSKPEKAPFLRRYCYALIRHRRAVHALSLLVTVLALLAASHLKLKTNIAQLLPESLPSVVNLHKVEAKLGGNSLLVVGVVGPRYDDNRRFVEDLAKKLNPLVGKSLRYFEYRYQDVKDFIGKFGLYYLDQEQLEKLESGLRTEIEKRKDESLGNFLGLGGDDSATKAQAKPKQNPLDALDGSLGSTFRKFLDYRDSYLSAENGKVMALMLKPSAASLSVGEAKKLRDHVQQIVDELKPTSYNSEIKVGFSGNVQQSIEEFDTIREDIGGTALLLTALVAGALLIFFRNLRCVLLLSFNLVVAVIWTFAVTWLGIGYLNTQTAFLSSLVVGTGINYGIIFLARFLELRMKDSALSSEEVIAIAVRSTAIPTLIASMTTLVSFLSLLISNNKGLSHFGVIGAVGVGFAWIAAFSLLPLWLWEIDKRWPLAKSQWGGSGARIAERLGESLVKRPRGYAVALILLTGLSAFGLWRLSRNALDYNFDNIRTKLVVDPEVAAFRKRVGQVFSVSLTPSVVLADSSHEAAQICPEVRKIRKSLPEDRKVVESCSSLQDFLPEQKQNPKRMELMKEIQKLMGTRLLKFSDYGETLSFLSKNMSFEPPRPQDIPAQVERRFVETDGSLGTFAYVYPTYKFSLNDGRNLELFTQKLSRIPVDGGRHTLSAAGNSFIFADLLNGLRRDAPLIATVSFVLVVGIAFFLAGGLRGGLVAIGCLVASIFWMQGLQGLLGIRYNFFNFIALPLTIGIGVDYPINILMRVKEEGLSCYGKVLASSGIAVLLCWLTTVIGYLTLLGAKSQALASFGRLALIGELTSLSVATILLPLLLRSKIFYKE
jgi:predicted RND superfamily exporter protein